MDRSVVDTLLVQYFSLSMPFCLKLEDRQALIARFNEIFVDYERLLAEEDSPASPHNFDIVTLSEEVSPLGFEFRDHTWLQERVRTLK